GRELDRALPYSVGRAEIVVQRYCRRDRAREAGINYAVDCRRERWLVDESRGGRNLRGRQHLELLRIEPRDGAIENQKLLENLLRRGSEKEVVVDNIGAMRVDAIAVSLGAREVK